MPTTAIKNIAKKGDKKTKTVDAYFKELESKLKDKLIATAKEKGIENPENYAYGTIMNMVKKKFEDVEFKTFEEYIKS
jgi:hypothetical protein